MSEKSKERGKESGEARKKMTLICSKGTLDMAYPPLILALNAVRQGADVEIFFTFSGMDVIHKQKVKKLKFYPLGFMGAIPGMATLATWMMKRKMESAKVPSIEELIEMNKYEGVKFLACKLTMDVMEIKKEELIDEAGVTDASAYIEKAFKSDTNMFT